MHATDRRCPQPGLGVCTRLIEKTLWVFTAKLFFRKNCRTAARVCLSITKSKDRSLSIATTFYALWYGHIKISIRSTAIAGCAAINFLKSFPYFIRFHPSQDHDVLSTHKRYYGHFQSFKKGILLTSFKHGGRIPPCFKHQACFQVHPELKNKLFGNVVGMVQKKKGKNEKRRRK